MQGVTAASFHLGIGAQYRKGVANLRPLIAKKDKLFVMRDPDE